MPPDPQFEDDSDDAGAALLMDSRGAAAPSPTAFRVGDKTAYKNSGQDKRDRDASVRK